MVDHSVCAEDHRKRLASRCELYRRGRYCCLRRHSGRCRVRSTRRTPLEANIDRLNIKLGFQSRRLSRGETQDSNHLSTTQRRRFLHLVSTQSTTTDDTNVDSWSDLRMYFSRIWHSKGACLKGQADPPPSSRRGSVGLMETEAESSCITSTSTGIGFLNPQPSKRVLLHVRQSK